MVTKLSVKEATRLEKEGWDLDFVNRIQSQGGVSFKNEDEIIAGDGHYSCLHIYELPKNPKPFWLTDVIGNLDTVVKVDISPIEKEVVIGDINKTLQEFRYRAQNERSETDRQDASDEYMALKQYARELNQGNEVTKIMDIRIYVTAESSKELDTKVSDLRKKLKGIGYKSVVFVGRQKEEWLAISQSYATQQAKTSVKEGVSVTTTHIGGSYPFNHQYQIDPRGAYLGVTDTEGAFVFDPFHTSAYRKSFSGMVLGKPGMGKSTFLKMIEENVFSRNCIVRGFEKNKDWFRLIKSQNGKILDLSGKDGMLNPLEPMAFITDETGQHIDQLNSYIQHRANFFNKIRFLNPDLRAVDIYYFSDLLDQFYIDRGLLPRNYMTAPGEISIIGRPPKAYPIIEEFYLYFAKYRSEITLIETEQNKQATSDFLSVLKTMTYQYGSLFNGHTTLENLNDEQVLFFDIETIGHFDEEIYRCQLYTAINIIWNQALSNGRRQKIALTNKEITIDEVQFFLVFLDECQEILNKDTVFVVTTIVKFLKEMRKFSAGAYFATQSPQELLPENSDDDYISKIKQVFELCNAKIFLGLDQSVSGTMQRAMGTLLTESEYEELALMRQGQALINLGGNENYRITVDPDESQLERFDGGH